MKNDKLKLYTILFIIVLTMIPFMSVGFSALTTSLNINGDLLVSVPQDPLIGNYEKSISNSYLSYTIYLVII